MESLVLIVALMMLSFWGSALFGLIFTFLGFRILGLIFGVLSILSGVYLLIILPYAPFLGTIQLLAGAYPVFRYFQK